MSETSITERRIQPYFDMEAFMNMSRETRLGGAVLERLVKLWGEWPVSYTHLTLPTKLEV